MQAFASGGLDVLVATTVIEVGIDVPNASVMLVEDAERFGLAQLHQLRGRVGRGPHRSFCILVSDATDELARRRLEVVRGSSDGFEIAEADLVLRGAGNLLGTRQSGLPPASRRLALRAPPPEARRARPRRWPTASSTPIPAFGNGPSWRACAPTSPRPRPAGTPPDAGDRRNRARHRARRATRSRDPTDHRPGQGDALRHPGRARARRHRARPVRGKRRDRDRGALARRTRSDFVERGRAARRRDPREPAAHPARGRRRGPCAGRAARPGGPGGAATSRSPSWTPRTWSVLSSRRSSASSTTSRRGPRSS